MTFHLNTHSNFSLLEGLPSPQELAEEAARQEMACLALTDHRLMTGAVEFYLACKKVDVQPILGLEVEVAWGEGRSRVALLSAGDQGWSNLCRISSQVCLAGDGQPASLEMLAANSTDVLALSGDQGDPSGHNLARLKEIYPDRLYVALPGPHYSLVELAERLHLPVAAAPPVFYLRKEQAALQKVVSAVRVISPLASLPASAAAPAAAYFLSRAELESRFKMYPGALAATIEIGERCRVELPVGMPHYPSVPLPAGKSAAQFLREKAESGAQHIYGRITSPIRERLEHELGVIANLGFEPVFLIVEELLDFARRSGIPTASRGSASSSLVAHCLGITTPDPLALDLYFERFLNPARTTPPDIDTDICSRGRDRVIQHVFDTYGEEHVAMVATINRFRPRSALADVAKAHGLAPDQVRLLANQLPYAFWARRDAQAEEEDGPQQHAQSPFADLKRRNPKLEALFKDAEAILRLPRHLSMHPGGLVVAPGLLTDRVSVMRSGGKGVIITQMDLESVEALGLVKIDLLGIRGLTVLGDVASAIHSWRRKEYKGSLDVLEAIADDDPETADCVEHGRTIGCFQIESPGMRGVLREIRARKPADVMAALALYRPGPLQGGLKDAFVRRFKGEEAPNQLHPALEPLLRSTYGVILYQEQVLQIAHHLAGLSLAEADLLRRAMSHFDPGKQMQVLKARFLGGVREKSGVPVEVGERVWDLMAAFAGYGFPKAHAASYAQVGWRSAWCKTHFPAEFMAAVLANWGGYYSQRVYLTEARRSGLAVRPPHINHAQRQFSVTYPKGEAVLYMGLDQVRDLTQRTQERIIRMRPFGSLEDFLTRVDPRQQEAECLARVGALEGLGNIPGLLRRITQGGWRAGQMALFGWAMESESEWTIQQRVQAQEEILGVGVDAHPLELVADRISAAGAVSTVDAIGMSGQRIRVAGLKQSSHRSQTSRGETMMFLTLEDLEGLLDVVFFPDVYRRYSSLLSGGKPVLVSGVMDMDKDRGESVLKAERVDRLS
jgi:DNA polymerase-3 subunit alpha